MNQNILQIADFVREIGYFPMLALSFLFGLYLYWYECRIVNKDKNSIFDGWLIFSIGSIIAGRISYILAFPKVFNNSYWFYLPYERINQKLYFFRALPWKYLALWDGGYLFTGVIFVFILLSIVYVSVQKKWSWKDMLEPVVISSQFMFGVVLFTIAVLSNQTEVILSSLIMLAAISIFFIFTKLSKTLNSFSFWIKLLYLLSSFIYIASFFWNQTTNPIDKANIIGLIISILLMGILYYRDSHKRHQSVEIEMPKIPMLVIEPNKPIKLGILRERNAK